MLLSALDPSLLMYQEQDWRTRQSHFFDRINSLMLHHRVIRQYQQRMAISNEVAALVYKWFPWNAGFKAIAELRDLRQFILEELGRARYIAKTKAAKDISLQPTDLTCGHVGSPTVLDAWKELLCACVEEEANSEFDVQVATWGTPVHLASSQAIIVTVNERAGPEDHCIPLVWDENSWASRLQSQDSWPDLHRCVELYFRANAGMRMHPRARQCPIPFVWTDTFWKSVEDLCQPQMRQLLVKAVAKRVYGILDARLHDEPLGNIRRFRVTDFWRVHYRVLDDKIVLDEFGEHDMGL